MIVKSDIERRAFMPYDMVPVNGNQLTKLDRFRDVIDGAIVTRFAPAWVGDRKADAWLVAANSEVACPLVWTGTEQGELIATVVLERDRLPDAPTMWLDALTAEPQLLGDREVFVTPHARERWQQRRPTVDLDEALLSARVATAQPTWALRAEPADAWLLIADDTCAPLMKTWGRVAVVTFLTREGVWT